MNRRYIDPHLDPLRAPSRLGQHPHLVPEAPSRRNPQQMYEFRPQHSMTYQTPPRPVGQPPPPQKPGLLDNPLVLLGLGAIAAYILMRRDDEPRQNPAPVPNPAPPPPQSFVVVAPGAQPVPVYTAMPTAPTSAPMGMQQQKQLSAPDPLPEVQQALDKASSAITAVVDKAVESAEDKAVDTTAQTAKRQYVRVTTQKRDPVTGAFLPAGTAKPRIEGAMSAKELQQKAKAKLEEARKKARKRARKRS